MRRSILATVLMLFAVGADAASSQNYEYRLSRVENFIKEFYRGKSLREELDELNDAVDAHNVMIEEVNLSGARSADAIDKARKPLDIYKERIEQLDEKLKKYKNSNTASGRQAYNTLVTRRNDYVRLFNEGNDNLKPMIKEHNKLLAKNRERVSRSSDALDLRRNRYDARAEREKAKGDSEAMMYAELNNIYGELTELSLKKSNRELLNLLKKAYNLRLELGLYSINYHRNNKHGLVIVEAEIAGITCFFIVDTGAMRTTIAPGLIKAMGLSDKLGEEIELSVAGGGKTKGRRVVLPNIKIAGVNERDIAAAMVNESEIGIDGLLGQSFLKRFVYTIDETKQPKLILRKKPELEF